MKPTENVSKISQLKNAKIPYQPGESPEKEAWFTEFFIENHLDHYSYPDRVATPEQIRFMVYTEEGERYYPCSDSMFNAIIDRKQSVFLQKKYDEVLHRVLALVDSQIEDKREKEYLKSLLRIKHRHETRDEIMIPSRLEKRLFSIFLNRTHIEDPYLCEKVVRNQRVSNALNSDAFNEALNHLDALDFKSPPKTLVEVTALVQHLKLKRLFALSVESSLWESDEADKYTKQDYLRIFNRPTTGNGVEPIFDFLGIYGKERSPGTGQAQKILWLANESGEIMVDLDIIRYLAKLGHTIIIAFKDGPLFTKIDFFDARGDDVLARELESALFIIEKNLGKNELAKLLRSDTHIFTMPDGTSENLNLLHTSTTFARVFKDVDCIISRGNDQRKRFFDTHFQFTQDIFNISEDEKGSVLICYKPKHSSVIKFSNKDLEKKAKAIIDQMENARKNGRRVIFYSGIVGSIPGKIDIAKKVMAVFIEHLKNLLSMTFIINPSEYYEQGMDADDLMYMWEIVQTSGLIDIWRFQSYSDIIQTFQIMDKKVPPEWIGKDATFSTGCTKEMRIATKVQKKHPEMQIIGPSMEKFIRRGEYGIGKMYDERLGEISRL